MQKVTKVLLYVFRTHNGVREFFIQHNHEGYKNVLSGHVGDTVVGETLEEAAERETVEELGVEPLQVTNLHHKEVVELLKWGKLSTEWAFLIEIPDKDVHFLEGNEEHGWYKLDQLDSVLTFSNHRSALPKILSELT